MDMLCHCGWVSRPAPWSPLPYEFRPISPQPKQAILRGVIHKATAQKMRDQLDMCVRVTLTVAKLGIPEQSDARGLQEPKKQRFLKFHCA